MPNSPLIDVSNVTLYRGSRLILDSVSLQLREKTLLGLIGPNGSGKTTLLRVIIDEIAPDSGTALIGGMPIKKAFASGFRIGYLPQRREFDRKVPLTALQTVLMARFGEIGLLKRPTREDRKIALDSLEQVDGGYLKNRLIGEVSGGEMQRILIARALAVRPKILLLDEPDAGVDMEASEHFMDLLARIRDEMDIGIILVSHDIGVITRHADYIACINRKLHFHDKPSALAEGDIEKIYGNECSLLIHNLPKRVLDTHD